MKKLILLALGLTLMRGCATIGIESNTRYGHVGFTYELPEKLPRGYSK